MSTMMIIIETSTRRRRRRRKTTIIGDGRRRLPPPPLVVVVVRLLLAALAFTSTLSSGRVTDAFVITSTPTNMIRRGRSCVAVNGSRKKASSSSSSLTSSSSSSPSSQQFQEDQQQQKEKGEDEEAMDIAFSSSSSSSSSLSLPQQASMSIDDAVMRRYACTRYERYVGNGTNDTSRSSRSIGSNDKQEETETEPALEITATSGDPVVIETAKSCLELARRSPSGFNVQPYKLLFLTSPTQKQEVSRYCCGHNAHRVRDSDCTVVFLADRQPIRSWNDYKNYVMTKMKIRTTKKMRTGSCTTSSSNNNSSDDEDDDDDQNLLPNNKETSNKLVTMVSSRLSKLSTWFKKFKVLVFISIFTQGFPYVPTILSEPISAIFCFLMRIGSWLTRSHYPIPTVSNSIAWSQKNTMLVAMSYMLLCSSRNLATTPMEGYTTWGVRKALKIPRRYTIPLIVTTGRPYIRNRTNQTSTATTTTTNNDDGNGNDNNNFNSSITENQSIGSDGGGISGSGSSSGSGGGSDDAGMVHGNSKDTLTKRYPSEMMIYENVFGGEK